MEVVNFYKEDVEKGTVWINKEYLIQLNITGNCPLNCSFCYIKHTYGKEYLPFKEVVHLWKNLRKYFFKLGIKYRVNLTGGDVFWHPHWKKFVDFLEEEESVVAVDPLLNIFWEKEHEYLLKKLNKKINYVQLNSDLVREEDINLVKKYGKTVILKYSLFKKDIKKNLSKLKKIVNEFDNVIISVDLIIPQKWNPGEKKDYYIFNLEELKKEIETLKKTFKEKLWLLSTPLQRIFLKRIYYCPVPFGGTYIMPDGKVVPCSRYSHLETGFTTRNFDLMNYVEKYNKLCSNFCLFENKFFQEFWKKEDNPLYFWEKNES